MVTVKVLEGQAVLATGGSRGIGAAIVRRLAADGASVVFGYQQDSAAAQAVVQQVRAAGGQAWAVAADLAVPEGIDALFACVDAEMGRLEVLVNNAGVPGRVALSDVTVAGFDQVSAVNTRAPLLAIQRASTRMSVGGRIINVSSVSTSWPAPDEILYAASKGALEQLSRVASRVLGARQITVNTVSPGTTDTEFLRANVPEQVRQAVAAMTPLGRLGQPADIAGGLRVRSGQY